MPRRQAFGWRDRAPAPRAMRDGEWWVGYGCAAAAYPAQIAAADCRATLFPDDRALIEIGTHDIGTGAYTILAQTAADGLGLPIERIEVRLGNSSAAGGAAHSRLGVDGEQLQRRGAGLRGAGEEAQGAARPTDGTAGGEGRRSSRAAPCRSRSS